MGLYGFKGSYDREGGDTSGAFLLANFWMMAVVESDMNRGVTVANALKAVQETEEESEDWD